MLPSFDTILAVGLWENIPVKLAGNLNDPAMSVPNPIIDAPLPSNAA